VRLAETLRGLLSDAAGAEDTALAMRALLVLGAASAGLDVRAFRREIASLMECDLAPGICASLRRLYDTCNTSVIHQPVGSVTPDEEELVDPFASIGIEV
jgi:hypothetical protein